jgi:hypothetical protein
MTYKGLRGVILPAAFVCVGLTGCVTAPVAVNSEEVRSALITQRLTDATASAVNAQRELALTADAKVQRELTQRQRLLTDRVSYDFYGDVEDLLREIASKYGCEFEIYGNRPPEHVNVNVFVSKKPVMEVLKQVGYTSTNWLDIAVKRDANHLPFKLELHYKTTVK